MKNPIQAFLEWYRSLAMGQRQYLAHMYIVLTTENTADLAMARGASPDRFEFLVLKKDFPMRMVSRLLVVRVIIDFIFINRYQLAQENPGPAAIVNLSEKQWEKGLESWKVLRGVELSDIYVNLWLKSELKMENNLGK